MDRILVTDPIDPAGIALLEKSAEVVRPPDTRAETLRAIGREVDALIIRSKLPDDLFEAAPRIRAVCVHGSGTDLVNPDFAALARSFGALGVAVERTEDFAPAFEAAVAAGRPALIELRVDPEALTPRQSLSEIRQQALVKQQSS